MITDEAPGGATYGVQVYQALKERLMAGELAPGEKISLRSVALELGVSMTPVREAVSKLSNEGALEVSPKRAVSVPLMTVDRYREINNVRYAVEGFAVEEACRHRTAAQLRQIRTLDKAFRSTVKAARPDAVRALRLNKELHMAIYRAAGSATLLGIIEGLWLQVGPVINLDLRHSLRRLSTGHAERQHLEIVEAIEAQDGARAREALVADIRGTADFIESTGVLGGGEASLLRA